MGLMLTAILALAQAAKADEGALTASNLTPGSLVLLLKVPADCRDAALYARLWSENEEAQLQALAALSEKEADTAGARLEELAKSGSLRVQGEAHAKSKTAKAGGDPAAARTIADIDGVARFAKVQAGRYHLYATRPLSADLHRAGVEVAAGKETVLDAKSAPPEPKAEGLRVRLSSGGKLLGEVPLRNGEALEVPVQGPTVRIEVTDAAPAGGERLGQIQLSSRVYGVYVRLDPGFAATLGEEVGIFRDGQEVARARIVKVLPGDARYPGGAVETQSDPGAVKKGDEVRRVKEENK
jgi:hypothetical protein